MRLRKGEQWKPQALCLWLHQLQPNTGATGAGNRRLSAAADGAVSFNLAKGSKLNLRRGELGGFLEKVAALVRSKLTNRRGEPGGVPPVARTRSQLVFRGAICLLLVGSVLMADAYSAVQARQESAADPTKYALIISGVSGDEEFAKKFVAWTSRLYDVLCARLQFSPDNVFVLSADVKPEKVKRFARATADEVMRAFTEINGKVIEQSLVFVFMVGHGSFDGQRATFNLVGRDLTAEDYAAVIRGLKTKRVVWVNTASASGAFLRPLSQTGAIVITATRSGHEQNATHFAEFFIQALSSDSADTDKNGRTSLFEAFSFANRLTTDYYKSKGLLATEHPVFDDNSDGVGRNEATEGEGLLARTFYLDSPATMRSDDPEMAALVKKKEETERALEVLKAKKSQMNQDDYERELERLLVELAKTDQRIKAKNK